MARRALVLLSLLGALGCDRASLGCGGSAPVPDAATPTSAAGEAPDASSGSSRLLLRIPFPDGEPASLLWHVATHTLYIADNKNNQVWSFRDDAGLSRLARTADPDGALDAGASQVGQIARTADGTLLVARFGKSGGGYGAIAYLEPNGLQAGLVPTLDPQRMRLGLDVAPDGRIFGSYFEKHADGKHVGAVTTVDLRSGERDYATGFEKVVGVLVQGDWLYVSDQLADKIYALPVHGGDAGVAPSRPEERKLFAGLSRPDQLCSGPDGSLFTGQYRAAPDSKEPTAVRQIAADGSVHVFAREPDVYRPSGVAYDPEGRRLFVANGGPPGERELRVFAVP